MTGETLGHYRIVEQIGAGGMGVVYRARDERLDRDVALKVLPAGALANENARKRFRKEALALAKLAHPNIAHIYDFDAQDGIDFLIMECVTGQSLTQRLASGSLSEKELASLGAEIAAALEEAHDQGIIHRDLKPGNILVTPKGHAKVLDFGLAKLLRPQGDAAATQSFIETQGVVGTIPYMAPEQLRGESLDARTDIYALGCVLYEMATCRRAFNQDTAPRLTDSILHQPPVSLRAVNSRISQELERIILKCLEKDAERRYQSAKELGVDLRRLSTPTAVTAAAPARRAAGWRRIGLPAAAVLIIAGLVVFLAQNVGTWRRGSLGGSSASRIRSLAVLPLENLSRDSDQDYFTDGLTEQLITDLAQISGLQKVVSRTSVMQYKGTRRPLPEIAKELGVDAVIEGSVQRSGERVRVIAQLIEAPADRHLWARSYERDFRDILALQSEVARAIAQEIQVKLTPTEESRLTSPRPVNPAAHEAYLRGLYSFRQGRDALPSPQGQEQMHQAIAYFQQAKQVDPKSALAYAGLAACEEWLASWTLLGEAGNRRELFEESRADALKALQLDDSLAEAHQALAWVLFINDWKFSESEKEFRRAIELNPNGEAHFPYADLLTALGRLEESKAEFERALQLDPLTIAVKSNAAGTYNCAREYDRAASLAQASLARVAGRMQLGIARIQQGATEEGIAELRRVAEITKENPFFMTYLAWAYRRSGRPAEAVSLLEEAKSHAREKPIGAEDLAAFYAAVGDSDHAFEWLHKAVEERTLTFVVPPNRCDPRFEGLRSDPRFADFLRLTGLP